MNRTKSAPVVVDEIEEDVVRGVLEEREQLLRERERLRREHEAVKAEHEQLVRENAALSKKVARLEQLEADHKRVLAEVERLKQKVEDLSRQLFGRSSEKVDPRELEQAAAESSDPPEPTPPPFANEAPDVETAPKPKKGHGRSDLPRSLPRERVEERPSPASLLCSRCGTEKQELGEEVTETLEYVPASFRVIEHVRKKHVCRTCGDISCQDSPVTPIEKGRPGPGLLAYVATAKYCDHLPLNRLEKILLREGVEIARSTLCDWIASTADLLSPIVAHMRKAVLASPVIGVDETEIGVRDKAAPHGIRKGRIWAYRGLPGEIVFVHTATKAAEEPLKFLQGYSGFLQADAARGYDPVFRACPQILEVACWAHLRRKFFNAKDLHPTEAGWALTAIRRLYAIEAEAKEKALDPTQRLSLRREKSKPLVDSFFAWLSELKPKGSGLVTAVRYAVNQEAALRRFLDDGRLEMDNNNVERALRQVAVGRKSWLFAGSAEGAERGATLYSLVVSCREIGVDPFSYMRDVIALVSTHPASRIDELTPRGWKSTRLPSS